MLKNKDINIVKFKLFLVISMLCIIPSLVIAKPDLNLSSKQKKPVLTKEKIPFSKQEIAGLYYIRANSLLQTGKDVEAAEKLQIIIENMPNHVKARLKLLEVYKSIGWQNEAENLINEGLILDKTNTKLIIHKATMFLDKNNPEKALSVLLKVIPKDRDSVQYKSILAMTYYELQLYELAKKNYSQLLRNDMQNAKWWLGLAITMEAEGDTKGAINSYKRISKLGGESAEVLHYAKDRILDLQENQKLF